jgi:hypothetical protein
MADLLQRSDGRSRLDLLTRDDELASLSSELEQLWSQRWIRLIPAALEARS